MFGCQWRRQDLVRGGAQNYMKLSVVRKITRNNTLNKVHVAVTELYRSCCRKTQICLERQPHKVAAVK